MHPKYLIKFTLVVFSLFLYTHFIFAATLGSLSGTVRDNETGTPLTGVNVFLTEIKLGNVTDANGQFQINRIPDGQYMVICSMLGYQIEKKNISIENGNNINIEVSLQPEAIKFGEVIVSPGHFGMSSDVKLPDQFLGVQEIKTTPGSQGDVFMVLATMPGIVSQGPTAPIYVQGGRSDENLVMFDHGVIASAFHMEQGGGGVYSIFNPAILRNVNLYTGGFGAEYGDRLSAVLDAETRDGSTERVTGSVAISTAFGEGVIEGPLPGTEGKGSFLISARRSYFDLLVSLTEYKESFVVFPNYYDLAAKFNYQLSPRHTLILTSLWASDNAIFKLRENESDIPGNVDMYSEKSLVSMKLESTLGRSLISRLVLSTSRAKYYEHTEDLWKNDQLKQVYTLREDILWDASTYHRIGVGVILDQRLHDIAMKMPNVFDFQERLRQEMPLEQLDASLSSPFFGTYVTDAWKTSSWLTLEVGIRTDYLNRTGEWTWSPRVAAAMKVTDNLTCKTAWGLYYQTPPLQETAEGYGNPHLRSRRAQHLILGLESTLPLDLTARVETYYKSFERLPMNDSLIGFNDRGKGYSYGAGVFVQRRFTSDLNGWASYSYTVARRSEYKYPISVPPDFDMPHHATIVATYDFAQNWQLGIRWHFTSGKPTNPIIGAILDSTSGSYKPIYGEPNSEHLPDYHLLDLRLLKKFHFSSWNLTVFLEVMNAYNRLNIAEYKWNSTYTERQAMTYFGIIPSIGIIAQF